MIDRPKHSARLGIVVAILSVTLLSAASASAQDWLQDQSYRGMPAELPTVPALDQSANLPPNGQSEGLLLPPPPLAELPPSVFDPPKTVEVIEEPAGPIWYYPWTWFPRDGWKNSAELGINGSAGNAESFSFQTGGRFKRKTDFSLIDFRITHNRTEANGVETQNNALANADFERFFGESRWTYFVKNGLEYDEFKAFDVRYNINSGFGYSFVDTDAATLKGRFGAGASREIGGPDNAWVPEALFGADYEHQLNPRNKVIAKIDYFPEWAAFENFRLVADVAWEYLIDEEGNLSLKLGANDRYDSTPNGRRPNDVNYSALLLYKF